MISAQDANAIAPNRNPQRSAQKMGEKTRADKNGLGGQCQCTGTKADEEIPSTNTIWPFLTPESMLYPTSVSLLKPLISMHTLGNGETEAQGGHRMCPRSHDSTLFKSQDDTGSN